MWGTFFGITVRLVAMALALSWTASPSEQIEVSAAGLAAQSNPVGVAGHANMAVVPGPPRIHGRIPVAVGDPRGRSPLAIAEGATRHGSTEPIGSALPAGTSPSFTTGTSF